jgi:hypothetical protein
MLDGVEAADCERLILFTAVGTIMSGSRHSDSDCLSGISRSPAGNSRREGLCSNVMIGPAGPLGEKMAVHVLAGYWNLDLETRELLLCPRSRQMFGIEGNSPKKLGREDWLPRVHPDDMPVIDCKLEAAGRLNEIYAARFRAVRPDGSLLQILGVGRTATKDPTRFVGLNFDLAATAASADLESGRLGGAMAKLANLLAVRSGPANENETPHRRPRRRLRDVSPGSNKRTSESFGRQMLLRRALATMEIRRLRHRFLDPAMFGEPAFDMLLALYVTNASPAILPLRILSPAIGVSESGAARWLKLLVDQGLALSVGGRPGEPGSIHATLTNKGRTVLDEYFKACDKVR